MNQVFCRGCGAELENGEVVLQYDEHLFCTMDCIDKYVIEHIEAVEVTDEYRL